MKRRPPLPLVRQRGIATLAICLVLIVTAGIATINASRGTLFEQKTSSNQYWATLAHEAAQAGLEQGMAWMASRSVPSPLPATCPNPANPFVHDCWQTDGSNGSTASPSDQRLTIDPSEPSDNLNITLGNGYTVEVSFHRETSPPSQLNFVQLAATASAPDGVTSASVQQLVYLPVYVVNGSGIPAAPLILNGCFYDANGGPHIYPQSGGLAMATLHSQALCTGWGHLDPHGGTTQTDVGGGSAWDLLFPGMTRDQMQAVSHIQEGLGLDDTTTPRRTVYWIDESSPWHASLGTQDEPVILIFSKTACASDCPKVNGSPVIYGIVYFDSDVDGDGVPNDADEVTKANGWGGAVIHGSVVIEGGVEDVNANSQFHYNATAIGNLATPATGTSVATRIPGSWRDY